MTIMELDQKLSANQQTLSDLKSKMKQVQKLIQHKAKPSQDAVKSAKNLLTDMKEPIHKLTQSCKQKYDQYIQSADPDLQHVDKMTQEVLDVQLLINKVSKFEKELAKTSGNKKGLAINLEQDRATLLEVKEQMGMSQEDIAIDEDVNQDSD